MNSTLKACLIFATGVAIGSGVTYVVVKKNVQSDADKQIEEMREYVDSKLRPYKIAEKMNQKAEEAEKKALEAVHPEREKEDYTDYTTITQRFIFDNDGSVSEVDRAEKESPKDEIAGPRIISEDEFVDVLPHYEKTTLLYYPDSGRLLDELTDQDEFVEIVGQANLDALVESGEEVMYIRNDKVSVDYEVQIMSDD